MCSGAFHIVGCDVPTRLRNPCLTQIVGTRAPGHSLDVDIPEIWREKWWRHSHGVRLAVAHSPVAIGKVGGLLEGLSMVAHRASGDKIENIMVVRELKMFCVIKHHSGFPITIANLIW